MNVFQQSDVAVVSEKAMKTNKLKWTGINKDFQTANAVYKVSIFEIFYLHVWKQHLSICTILISADSCIDCMIEKWLRSVNVYKQMDSPDVCHWNIIIS